MEGPQTYAGLRIGLGALVIANVWTMWPHLEYLHGDLGVSPAASACAEGIAQLSILCHLPPWGSPALIVMFTAAALMFTVGLWTRVSGVLTVLLYASLWWRSGVSWAGEHVFGDFFLLLCLARCGEAYSVDRWLRRRRGGDDAYVPVPSWPRYLMIVQLALCLGVNGWAKSGATWRSGEAVFYVLAHDRYHRFPPWEFLNALGPELMQGLTWIAWLTERGFPLVVMGLLLRPWLRRAGAPGFVLHLADWTLGRRIWATLAVSVLLGITTLINVGWFVPATAVAVLCLFRGDELGRALARGGVRARGLAEVPFRARWRMIAASAFIGWHGWVMTTRAIVPLAGETVAAPIAAVMHAYQRVTNTNQMWRMFSRNVETKGSYLRVVAITGDGQRHDAPSDLDLLEHGQRINIGYDRRQKIHSTLLRPNSERLRHAHGRWVCRTWTAPDGGAPVEVVLIRIVEPLPLPAWTVAKGAVDPHPEMALEAREDELERVDCSEP